MNYDLENHQETQTTQMTFRDEEHATMATRSRPIIVYEPDHLKNNTY